jgi:hypothetical protein
MKITMVLVVILLLYSCVFKDEKTTKPLKVYTLVTNYRTPIINTSKDSGHMTDTIMSTNDTIAFYNALIRFHSSKRASYIFTGFKTHFTNFEIKDPFGANLQTKLSREVCDSLYFEVQSIENRLNR